MDSICVAAADFPSNFFPSIDVTGVGLAGNVRCTENNIYLTHNILLCLPYIFRWFENKGRHIEVNKNGPKRSRTLATSVFVGVQPTLTHVPPKRLRSMIAVLKPAPANREASVGPAWPGRSQ